MHEIIFTEAYTQRAIRFIRKHPQLRQQYEKCLQLLELNPYHPSLRLHKLQGQLQGLHTVSINITYRITIEIIIRDNVIIPIAIGSHDELLLGGLHQMGNNPTYVCPPPQRACVTVILGF